MRTKKEIEDKFLTFFFTVGVSIVIATTMKVFIKSNILNFVLLALSTIYIIIALCFFVGMIKWIIKELSEENETVAS